MKKMTDDAFLAGCERRRGWSIKRAERRIVAAIEAEGLDYRVRGDGSRYIRVEGVGQSWLTIRISDHAQADGGGYNVGRGERHGEADLSVDPWGVTVEAALREVRAFGAQVRTDEADVAFEQELSAFNPATAPTA